MTKETQTVWRDNKNEVILTQINDGPRKLKVECCYLTTEKAIELRDALHDFLTTPDCKA